MDFISNSSVQIEEMLKVIGVSSVEDLFSAIPSSIKLPKQTQDDGLSEMEGFKMMEELGKKNTFSEFTSYLGSGAYQHYIPSIVPFITSKSEFLTSYTPYQAEASQGTLEAIFEYQSSIVALTGLDVANASVWDAASACAEGVLMAARLQNNKKKVLIAETLHPHYFGVVKEYLSNLGFEIIKVPFETSGQIDQNRLKELCSNDAFAFLVQSPNVLGVVEDMKTLVEIVHHSAQSLTERPLVIQCANPLSYSIYQPPGETGVDIAVGDSQPFGLPLNFGGPYAGYMATKKDYVRQLPGRIIGQTKDINGKMGYTLILQAREQHIRREKALSNICTNQSLNALASVIAILWYGPKGLKELALTNFQRASYLKSKLMNTLSGPIFNEFSWKPKAASLTDVLEHFKKNHILPGLPSPLLKDHLTVCVTECKTKEDLDRFVEVAHDFI